MSEDEAESWHWADADGVVSIVDEWELLSSLSTATLPHYTLVWRGGWKQWLPACQVAELANILPKDKLEKAVDPGSDPLLTDPPPPPVDRYQAYQTREAAAKLMGKSMKPAARVPVAPPGLVGAGAPPPPPPPPAPRPAQPTLVEGAQLSSTATLRPPGAVPPPPRGVPAAPLPAAEPAAPTPIVAAPVAPVIQVKHSEEPAPISAEVPTNPRALAPLPSWSDDLDAEMRAGAMPSPGRMLPTAYATPGPPVVQPAAKKSPVLLLASLAVGGLGLIGVVGVVALLLRSSKDEANPAASGSSAAGAQGSGRILPCKLDKSAARLAPSVLPSVVPVTAAVAGGAKFAVGYAASEREAEGMTVDPTSLAVERPFRQKTERGIASVVPLAMQGDLAFVVDQEDRGFRSPRTLDGKGKLTLGWSDAGLARRAASGEPATIWASPSDKVTDPRPVALPGGGFAVTARRGGLGGSIVVGLIDDAGEKKSELTEVSSKPQVGTPSIAANERGTLVSFAGRPTDNSYWTLQVGTAPAGATPKSAQSFATPPGGLGADAISPAVEGLSNGRWLLQWTEGAAGRRQVRIQTLGFDLVPVGDPITLSPEEANAGQGVVMVRGEKALSLFLVLKGKTHELWGATLTCP
ncbi:MAG: DUF4339 domain-containing protein [Polyangiaceae bacterium]|nr:DUF4339 domain-containing protein [Polyangiaceae bacterium]MCL4751691.1 hypothetical protein [Myxococcales bacterium]